MRYDKRLIMALILLFLLLASLWYVSASLGHVSESKESVDEELMLSQADDNLIVVGFSQLGSESVWRTTHTKSIQDALSKENGFFLQYNNARQKQENQIKALRSYISQRVDYIVFAPLMEDGWENVLQEAKDAGIPVILVDRKISGAEDLYTTFIGSDMEAEGRKAGEWLESYQNNRLNPNERVNIVVLTGTLGSTSQIGRSRGFDSIADQHENWHVLSYQSGDFTVVKGKEVMARLLKTYDNIDIVVSQNDEMTFGAMEAIREAGLSTGHYGRIKLISFDGVGEALELVKTGKINCDVECNPLQGELVAEVIHKLERGEKIEKEYFVDEMVFTKDNVQEYLEERVY